MGGAMDLVSGSKRVVVLMSHTSKNGEPKLLDRCELPLTGERCVDRVITELGVLDITDEGFRLVELAEGVSLEQMRESTGAPIHVV